MSRLNDARDALAARIANEAALASEDKLVKLADAYQKVRFGPAGYDSRLEQTQDNKNTNTNTNTNTTTTRYEKDRRGPTGFGVEGFDAEPGG